MPPEMKVTLSESSETFSITSYKRVGAKYVMLVEDSSSRAQPLQQPFSTTHTLPPQKERVMSYLSIVLVSCLATLSLASPVARQSDKLPYTIVPCDVAGNFTMLALRNETGLELVTPLALGLNGLAGAEYSLAVFTLFFSPGCFEELMSHVIL